MSVRPIEFQVSISKTFEASKEQQNFLKRADIDAQQKVISANEESNRRMSSVGDVEQTEKKVYGMTRKEKIIREVKIIKKKKKEEESLSENKSFCFDPGKIDIKI